MARTIHPGAPYKRREIPNNDWTIINAALAAFQKALGEAEHTADAKLKTSKNEGRDLAALYKLSRNKATRLQTKLDEAEEEKEVGMGDDNAHQSEKDAIIADLKKKCDDHLATVAQYSRNIDDLEARLAKHEESNGSNKVVEVVVFKQNENTSSSKWIRRSKRKAGDANINNQTAPATKVAKEGAT